MAAKKIRYLLEERGRFYYQRKVPKILAQYIGSSKWHIPVGGTFDAAQTAVRALETENGKLKKLLAETMLPSRVCFTYPAGQRM